MANHSKPEEFSYGSHLGPGTRSKPYAVSTVSPRMERATRGRLVASIPRNLFTGIANFDVAQTP